MNFKPKTDDELYPKYKVGKAQFRVVTAKEGESKSHPPVPYIELNIEFFDEDGRKGYVHDWLYGSDKSMWKLKQFCDSVGLENEYMQGSINPDMCRNMTGECMLDYKKNIKTDKDEVFIARYVAIKGGKSDMGKPQMSSQQASTLEPFADDDIPF